MAFNRIINVGEEYQAEIPDLRLRTDEEEEEDEQLGEDLIFTPSKIDENELDRYLSEVRTPYCGKLTEEQALFLLHRCDYSADEALLRYQHFPEMFNGDDWTTSESEWFTKGLKRFGKNFTEIQKMLPCRSVSELVERYYLKKKPERLGKYTKEHRITRRQLKERRALDEWIKNETDRVKKEVIQERIW